ncbi:hypothetical protein Aperf_G00000048262 [Anoplocephala perfoliata]
MTKGANTHQGSTKRGVGGESGESLLRAARAGDLKKVTDLIKSGVDVNSTNPTGLTALHLAAKEGHTSVVKELILHGTDVNAVSKKGNTALHISSLAGHLDVVQALIDANANPNCQSAIGFTPLYMAAQENHLDVVILLLNNGANQSLATEDGFTPLAVALQQGHDRVVATLLERDTRSRGGLPALHVAARKDDINAANLLLMSPDANVNHQSQPGFTALHIAAHYGKTNVGNLLIQRGADVNFQAKNNITPLHVASKWGRIEMVKLLLDNGALFDSRTRDGLTPLHCAARSGHNAVCTMLIDAGCNPSAKTRNGLTPLHMAAQGNHEEVARNLIARGANLQAVTGDFLNPLHVAAHCGNVKVAKVLIDKGCDMNARALAGLTPLHVAAFLGSAELVRVLLEHGASVEQTTMRGETPLHLGARSCRPEVAELLLKHGAAVNAKAKDDQTPLHIATLCGCVDMVYLLLKFGADPNIATRDAYTALHISARDGRADIVQCLLANGADPYARTKRGFSPLHLAAKRGRAEAARTLLQVMRPEAINAVGRNGLTPLHMAAHYNHVQLVQLLLEFGADPDLAASNGYTALHIAAKRNHQDLASLLLANDREPTKSTNRESRCGFTPLHLAAQEGNADMVGLLLLNGADAEHKAKNGVTPMHLAALEDHVMVAQQLVHEGAKVTDVTQAGYTPLHTACYAGRLNMARFLIALAASDINAKTRAGFTPLHLAAQQGHSDIIYLLLEHGADPNAKNNQGLTPAEIARHQHYLAIFDTLKTVTTTVSDWDDTKVSEGEEILLDQSEVAATTNEATEAEEFDEEDMLASQHVDQTLSYPSQYQSKYVRNSQQQQSGSLHAPDEQMLHETTAMPEHSENLSATLMSDIQMGETSKVLAGPGDHLDAEWEMETEPTPSATKKPLAGGFLVSFLVDARGGLLESKRYPGMRFIIPPNASLGPLRIICRLLRYFPCALQPPLNDGEGLACRLIEVGPIGVRFNSPILIELPYCASVHKNQREIIVLRSENGEVWKEHPVDPTDQAVQDSLGEHFADAIPSTELRKRRVHRILTSSIPQYFALITRPRQDLVLIGPEGCTLTSSVDPQVKVSFPRGALQKKIRVGLQVQTVNPRLVETCLGSPRIAISPIVTIEPRRRKFHRPIVVFIPLPTISGQKSRTPDLSTVRLLCSITGGTSPAVWEDITGSSPFSLQNDCVSFTTTVSARFWLIDCPNLSEVSEMAARVYREATAVPYLGRFVIYARRHHPEEAHIRCVCLTDDTEQKTLECQEGFEVIARSGNFSDGSPGDSTEGYVEFLHNRSIWVETAGNFVPVAGIIAPSLTPEENDTPAVNQLRFSAVRAFEENRLNMLLRIKDVNAPPVGQLAFMPQQKQPGGQVHVAVEPLCVLEVRLPQMVPSSIQTTQKDISGSMEDSVANFFNGTPNDNDSGFNGHRRLVESIARSDLDLKKVADHLGADWRRLAPFLGLSEQDVNSIKENGTDSEYKMAFTCLTLWQERNGSAATGTALARALRQAGREHVLRQSMQNISLVQQDPELSHALRSLEESNGTPAVVVEEPRKPSPISYDAEELMMARIEAPSKEDSWGMVTEPPAVAADDGVVEEVIISTKASRQQPSHTEVSMSSEEKKAALEDLLQQLDVPDDGSQLPEISAGTDEKSVEEEAVVAETVKSGQKLESAVPAFLLEDIEREETSPVSSPVHPSESLDVDSANLDSVTEAATVTEEIRTPGDATEIKTSKVGTIIEPESRLGQQFGRSIVRTCEADESDIDTPRSLKIEDAFQPEFSQAAGSVDHSEPLLEKSAIGLNQQSLGRPDSSNGSPKRGSIGNVMEELVSPESSNNALVRIADKETKFEPESTNLGERNPVDSSETAEAVFEADEFIIQPVVYPLCGANEATWGRAQSPLPSPTSSISTAHESSANPDDIPLIVPTVVERLGEREDTWGKPQEPL